MASNEAGKGDKQRPTNYNSFSSNYDLCFKKKTNEQKTNRAVSPTQEDNPEQLFGTGKTAHDQK